jgi:hypothetical protein
MQTWQTTDRRLAAIRLATESDVSTVAGRVVDATTGLAVAGVPLSLKQGWNATIGDPALDAATTDEDGAFRFQASVAGAYTVEAASTDATGLARFPAFLTGSGTRAVGLVAPPTEPGQYRASIVWGSEPFDLDLHLSAPLRGGQAGEDGTGQYHVWSGDPTHPDRPADGEDYDAEIELSSTTGYGPETIFVRNPPGYGEVRFSVLDDDHLSDDDSTALAGSDVVMQVWSGEDVPRYFTVSPGQAATLWRPVVIDSETWVVYAVEQYDVGVDPSDPTAF